MNLLTRDEAAEAVAASALRLADALGGLPARTVCALLRGGRTRTALTLAQRQALAAHRRTLGDCRALGYLDVAEPEVDGVASALGLDGVSSGATARLDSGVLAHLLAS